MIRHYLINTFILAVLMMVCSHNAFALNAVDTITFAPEEVVDTLSGNNINFSFEHHLFLPDPSEILITNGTLEITHEDNSNEGPTKEIWWLLSEGGDLIGTLSNSDKGPVTDTFSLPDFLLNALEASAWNLKLDLSEQTSFNSEKILLYQSKLSLDYEEKANPSTPSAPEPSSLLLLGLSGLLCYGKRLRKIK